MRRREKQFFLQVFWGPGGKKISNSNYVHAIVILSTSCIRTVVVLCDTHNLPLWLDWPYKVKHSNVLVPEPVMPFIGNSSVGKGSLLLHSQRLPENETSPTVAGERLA